MDISHARKSSALTTVMVIALIVSILMASGVVTEFSSVARTRTKGGSNNTTIASALTPIREIPLASESEPLGITIGPNGNVWFAENNSTRIMEYLPRNQTFKSFPVPINGSSMIWFMRFDSHGYLWFANQLDHYLWRFSPSTHEFANFTTGSNSAYPFGIAFDSATNQVWFTSTYTDQIGYFNITSSENAVVGPLINVTGNATLSTPPRYGPTGIQIGPQGNIFISEPFSGNIIVYSPSRQEFTHVWKLPAGSQPVGINIDTQNKTVWFPNHASSLFGYVNETTGESTEFATSPFEFFGNTISLPYWARLTPNGIVWFDEHASNKIARYDPTTGILTEFAVPTNRSAPLHFVVDNQRHVIWFTEFFGYNLGEINEGASCNCTVKLSTRNLTLSSSPASFYLKYIPSANQSLNSDSPAPLITGTFRLDGYVTDNLTISSTVVNSSYYKITLSRGQDLIAGNYSITVCPRIAASDNITNPAPVRQCATASLTVIGNGTMTSGSSSSVSTSTSTFLHNSSMKTSNAVAMSWSIVAVVLAIVLAASSLLLVRRNPSFGKTKD